MVNSGNLALQAGWTLGMAFRSDATEWNNGSSQSRGYPKRCPNRSYSLYQRSLVPEVPPGKVWARFTHTHRSLIGQIGYPGNTYPEVNRTLFLVWMVSKESRNSILSCRDSFPGHGVGLGELFKLWMDYFTKKMWTWQGTWCWHSLNTLPIRFIRGS